MKYLIPLIFLVSMACVDPTAIETETEAETVLCDTVIDGHTYLSVSGLLIHKADCVNIEHFLED